MRQRWIRNISINGAQQITNQLLGLAIFYIISRELSKTDFGVLNWALALLFSCFTILSFGIDQLAVRKMAAGENVTAFFSAYAWHVLLWGTALSTVLVCIYWQWPGTTTRLLLLLCSGKLLLFFTTPIRQAAQGREQFHLLAIMSVVSNGIRAAGLLFSSLLHPISLHQVIYLFILGDSIECMVCVYLYLRYLNIPVSLSYPRQAYRSLLREAWPQLGVVLATSALAKFDWLLIGTLASASTLAEYSFAYKAFEISTMPLLIIAPLLIPRFTKYVSRPWPDAAHDLAALLRIEMIACCLVLVLVNTGWAPVIDPLTRGKYGQVNTPVIFLLSLCTPFLYLNNLLWTMLFAKGELKSIFSVIAITCGVNIAANCLLVPFAASTGAAAAYLIAQLIQTGLYLRKSRPVRLLTISKPLIGCLLCAGCAIWMAGYIPAGPFITLPVAALIYLGLLLPVRQLLSQDIRSAVRLLSYE